MKHNFYTTKNIYPTMDLLRLLALIDSVPNFEYRIEQMPREEREENGLLKLHIIAPTDTARLRARGHHEKP